MNRFHAHIYYDGKKPQEIERARLLRKQLAGRFNARVGTFYKYAVGPHSKPMFQALFTLDSFAVIVTWLMQNRGSLSVLIHAATGDDLEDHTQHTMWLGSPLPLKLENLN